MEIIYILAGLVVGALIAYFFGKSKSTAAIAVQHSELSAKLSIIEGLTTQIGKLEGELAQLTEKLSSAYNERSNLLANNQTLKRELELLGGQMERETKERQVQFAQQLELVKSQLKETTGELLKRRSEELSKNNSTQMSAIVDPLKETIKEMNTAMDHNRTTSIENKTSLEMAVREVLKRANEIGTEADKLAKALRSENKIQGNWGEMILEELLRSQGLEEGKHYDTQVTLRDSKGQPYRHDETGKKMMPDVVLHYPDNKDAVIDSKVSLTAFLEYQNATTEEEREDALQRHLNSIRAHVKELSKKSYNAYITLPRQSLDYVIMFVPIEAALQLALYNDTTLWRTAFENGVFITSEQNLTAALRMIRIAWVHMAQTRSQEEVFKLASDVVKRVAEFYDRFGDIGKKLEAVSKAYTEADKKLQTGTQSLVAPAHKLVAMGAKEDPKKPLPAADGTLFIEE